MNRRSFFKTLATAAAGFAILPSATSYTRAPWKRVIRVEGLWIPNPEYANAPYEVAFYLQENGKPVGCLFHKFLGDPPTVPPNLRRVCETLPLRYKSPDFKSQPIPPYIKFKARASILSSAIDQRPVELLGSEHPALDSPTERPIFALPAPLVGQMA